jgi:alkyl hydroperoxide reductase subunit F
MEFNLQTKAKAPAVTPETIYDVLVVGGGPAGLNAALYAKRKGLSVGILAERLGGQVLDTSSVENYLGFPSETGEELMKKFQAHVGELKVSVKEHVLVTGIDEGRIKKIHTNTEVTYQAKAVILATGSKPRMLKVPGEKEFLGRGVAYCAICDGPLFAGMDVIVAGGGNSAVEAAIDLAKIANHVHLVHRSHFRADQILVDQLRKKENVTIHLETQIQSVEGEGLVSHVNALDKASGRVVEIPGNGLFVEIGYLPNSGAFTEVVKQNGRGEIEVNARCETSVAGIFAAGDVTNMPYKQIVISAGEGAKAALTANEYINTLKEEV